MLQFMGLQRVEHNWVTEQQQAPGKPQASFWEMDLLVLKALIILKTRFCYLLAVPCCILVPL